MTFEKMLLVILIFGTIIQFYLSFIKGKRIGEDYGSIVYTLKVNELKIKLIGFLLVLMILYLANVAIKNKFNLISVLIVLYMLISIYDFTKIKIVTSNGIAYKSIYSKAIYKFVGWHEIKSWYWHEKRDTMLVYTYERNGKSITTDWEVGKSEKEEVDTLFKKYLTKKEEN